MNSLSRMVSMKIPELQLWSEVKTFVDIGGGNGLVSRMIAEKHPHTKGYVGELSQVRKTYEEFMPEHLKERV